MASLHAAQHIFIAGYSKEKTMQTLSYYQQEQLERMTGAGSDYPSTITPLGFVWEYSLSNQALLLPVLAANFGIEFYVEVMRLKMMSAHAIALATESEPLWQHGIFG